MNLQALKARIETLEALLSSSTTAALKGLTTDSASQFLKQIKSKLDKSYLKAKIVGGVAKSGYSENDLDIALTPIKKVNKPRPGVKISPEDFANLNYAPEDLITNIDVLESEFKKEGYKTKHALDDMNYGEILTVKLKDGRIADFFWDEGTELTELTASSGLSFHGTSVENAKRISRDGLKTHETGSFKNIIWTTTNELSARAYGRGEDNDSTYAIIVIKPEIVKEKGKLIGDAVIFDEDLPVKAIKEIRYYKSAGDTEHQSKDKLIKKIAIASASSVASKLLSEFKSFDLGIDPPQISISDKIYIQKSGRTKEDKYWDALDPEYILGEHSFKGKSITLYLGSIKKKAKRLGMSSDYLAENVLKHELGHYAKRHDSSNTPFDEAIADEWAKKHWKGYRNFW